MLENILTWKTIEHYYAGKTEISKYKTSIKEVDEIYTGLEW